MRKWTLGVAAIGAVVIVVIAVSAAPWRGGAGRSESFSEKCIEVRGDSEREAECLIEAALEIAERPGGWQEAIDMVGTYLEDSAGVDEHYVMHELALRAEVSIEAMEDLDIGATQIGFLHGWMVDQLAGTIGIVEARDVYERVCLAEQNLDIVEDCAHGFGHVAYQQNWGSFAEMEGVCMELYPDRTEAGLGDCYSGLFMAYGPEGNSEPRRWGRVKRISWETAVAACSGTEGEAAKRCWPWVYWLAEGSDETYERYAKVCEAAGEAARWCGKGIAFYEMYVRQRNADMRIEDLIATCARIQNESEWGREIRIGCAAQAIELDMLQWWTEGHAERRTYPCGGEGEEICREALEYLESRPCDAEPDNAERVALCQRNRDAG